MATTKRRPEKGKTVEVGWSALSFGHLIRSEVKGKDLMKLAERK
jgi:hypothetical protein